MNSSQILHKCKSISKTIGVLPEFEFQICTDTRKLNSSSLFVALKGEKFDAHEFINSNLFSKAKFFVVDISFEVKANEFQKLNPEVSFILVSDTLLFLQEFSKNFLNAWRELDSTHHVIAISGSNGKTTHKEMLRHLLGSVFIDQIVATEKNNNNHLGVPLTILNITKNTKNLILELGSNHPGEIKALCDIAHPELGVVTNIGSTHLEFFSTEENVFKEEGYLYEDIKNNVASFKRFYINTFDQYLKTFKKESYCKTFGEKNCDYVFSYKNNSIEVTKDAKTYILSNPNIIGRHNFHNLAVSFCIAIDLYPEKASQFEKAASNFTPRDNRSIWTQYENVKVFLDAYNANPSSMKISLTAFIDYLKEQSISFDDVLFILGDMNELGTNGPGYHEDIGSYLNSSAVKNVRFIGKFADFYGKNFHFDQKKYADAKIYKQIDFLKDLKKYKILFLKGSRSLQLESILDIKEH